jgi:hypothetical protein
MPAWTLKLPNRASERQKLNRQQGNSYIRKALYMPSLSNIKCDRNNKAFYERLLKRKDKAMVAPVAVRRKMPGLMFSLWKNEKMYDEKVGNETKCDEKNSSVKD